MESYPVRACDELEPEIKFEFEFELDVSMDGCNVRVGNCSGNLQLKSSSSSISQVDDEYELEGRICECESDKTFD
jgi:hypothetical protein